ncbi:MAG: ABC transporter substrate-binding protein [Thermoplasmata archaeon]
MDPRRLRVIAIVVAVVVVVAGVATYVALRNKASASNCNLQSKNPLIIEQAETIDSFDPDAAATTPEWGAVQQVYQPLIMYNQSSYTNFTGLLANNWSSSADGFHWNFTLRSGIHFSNGDPINAYVMWYSFNRVLALDGIDQYLLAENFWYPNVNYYSNTTQVNSSLANLTADLNAFTLQTITNPGSAQLAIMQFNNQSFQVINESTIQLNLGNGYLGAVPYTYLLAAMASPAGVAVDPVVINSHGGVNGPTNSWMASNALGSGPYLLQSYNPSTGYTLVPDPHYWGTTVAAQEPWNNAIQPAQLSIEINFEESPDVSVQDLTTRAVASASFAYLGPSTIHQLQATPCLVVNANSPVFAGASGSWWVYMNQTQAPFNNISVREAVAHAINYTQVFDDAFGGYATQWVGPVAPGHPYYNPANLAPYSYNLTLARQEMANSPWPSGYPTTMNFMYLDIGTDWEDVAMVLQSNLAAIGIKINPQGVDLDTFYQEQTIDPTTGQCTAQEVSDGSGPFPIGLEFYSSDYISPDDWTQQDALSYGTANQCTSGYANATMDNLVLEAAGEHNATNLTQEYTEITQLMYQNYTDAWLAVPTFFTVYSSTLGGLYPTPMGSTELATMLWNTIYVKS